MLDCAGLEAAMDRFSRCEVTSRGTRFATHCLYPSFEQVHVYVVGHGTGFIIHDGGGAAGSAWEHGAERSQVLRALQSSAKTFNCEVKGEQLRIGVDNADWLYSGIISVANASSDAARAAVGKVRISRETRLIEKAKFIFDAARWRPITKLEYAVSGKSGKVHHFDLAVEHNDSVALIDAVVSHPTSIAAKYLAFADTERRFNVFKYALYDGELASEDKSLLSDVADLVSFQALVGTDGHFLLQ